MTARRDTLTTAEVAQRLGISPHTVTRAIDRGEFPMRAIRIGRTLRFSKAEVDRYLQAAS